MSSFMSSFTRSTILISLLMCDGYRSAHFKHIDERCVWATTKVCPSWTLPIASLCVKYRNLYRVFSLSSSLRNNPARVTQRVSGGRNESLQKCFFSERKLTYEPFSQSTPLCGSKAANNGTRGIGGKTAVQKCYHRWLQLINRISLLSKNKVKLVIFCVIFFHT